jgi:TPR repeat protein
LAEQGDAAAQHNLGILYETGTGVMRQDGPAEEWYRRAAEQGLHEAQYQLAAILAADAMADQGNYTPKEVEQRFIEAYMWLLLAHPSGLEIVANSLPRLEQHMTEEHLEEAERLARERRIEPPST